ncbi:MAG: ribonuclease [Clostridia bacterium]|nr:ribonuclease [Clostridia bacterium]
MKKLLVLLLALMLLATGALGEVLVDGDIAITEDSMVEYGQPYDTPEEVALYLHVFCELPPNFITKAEARKLGWVSSEGNLWDVAYGCSIGGDIFGNREGLLPEARDRTWYECDVNYQGGFRGSDRLLFASDGLIYFSNDHYQTFTQLYDDWYEYEDAAA